MSHHNPHPSNQPNAANEDQNLVQFLRQYRPPVPTAAADLENRMIQGLPAQPSPYRWARTRAWASVPVLAASALLMWPDRPLRNPIVKPVSPVVVSPIAETQLSEAELASLGSFLESPADSPSSSQDWLTLITDAAESPHPHS
jgi:hypothetical protein